MGQNKYLSDFIYGGIDGTITTIAIISGSIGAGMPIKYLLIISLSSLLADGFSMGISSYLSTQTKNEINRNKNEDLDDNTLNKRLMAAESAEYLDPLKSGIVTFISFIMMGIIPISIYLYDYIIKREITETTHIYAYILSLITLFSIGSIKNKILSKNIIYGGLNTLIVGFMGAIIAFSVGKYLNKITKEAS